MKLSTKSKYGIRAMIALAAAQDNNPVSINSISIRENISAYYLEQLFLFLKNGRLIKSTRGQKGGYRLARPANQITIGEILRLLEGSLEITDCTDGIGCSREGNCAARVLWKKVKFSMENVLNSITLQDILDDYSKENEFNNIKISNEGDVYI